jgi:uncharacterized protein
MTRLHDSDNDDDNDDGRDDRGHAHASSDSERCAKSALFTRIHNAFHSGDLDALRAALDDPPDFPNVSGPIGICGPILEYAIYHSPIAFIRTLLERGASPNYADHIGFPSLIAAMSCMQSPKNRPRDDVHQVMRLLIEFGVDVQQRGVNDYTPLHYAAMLDDEVVLELLLAHGADPAARTCIDDYETPLELAERGSHRKVAERLRRISR